MVKKILANTLSSIFKFLLCNIEWLFYHPLTHSLFSQEKALIKVFKNNPIIELMIRLGLIKFKVCNTRSNDLFSNQKVEMHGLAKAKARAHVFEEKKRKIYLHKKCAT